MKLVEKCFSKDDGASAMQSVKQKAPHSNEEPSITRSVVFRRLLILLITCVTTFLIAEAAARLLVVLGKPVQSHALEFDRKYQLATTKAPSGKPVVLILGDSLIDFALYPELLSSRLKEKGVDAEIRNLAVPGSTLETGLFLLQAAVDKGIKPDFVIYDVHPRLYNRNYYRDANNTNPEFTRSLTGRCRRKQTNWSEAATCFFKKNFYLVGYRGYLKDELLQLQDTIFKPGNRLKFESSPYPKIEVSPAGWAPGYQVFTDAEFRDRFSKPGELSKVAAELNHFEWTETHFLKLQQYCRMQQIPLLMVWLPEHPITAEYHRKLGVSEVMLNQKFRILFEKTDTGYVSFHRLLTRSDQFHTPDHVNPLGAIPLTEAMAAFLLEKYPDTFKAQKANAYEK